jgi:hypothetical protein
MRVGQSILWGLFFCLCGLNLPSQAQQFDFTPPADTSGSGLPVPVDIPSPTNNPSAEPPLMPILTQPTDPVIPQTVTPPVWTTPTDGTETATSDTYSFRRRQNLTPTEPGILQRGELPRGTSIPLTVYRQMIFPPFQSISSHLEVVNPVINSRGQVIIPSGSTVWGTFEPVVKTNTKVNPDNDNPTSELTSKTVEGSRFVANRITIQSATYVMNGSSELLPITRDPEADVGNTALQGAGYGALGGLALGILTGGIGWVPIMAGGVTGATAGTTNVDRVVTLNPNTVITVELTSDLVIE